MERINPESLDLETLERQLRNEMENADFDPKRAKRTEIPPNVAMALVERCKDAEAALQEAGEALQRHLDDDED
jgi:hypothetical protein